MGLEQTLMTKISAKAEQNKIAAVLDKADHVQAYLAMNGLQKRADFNSTMNALGDWAKANPEAAGGIAGLLGGGALGGILGGGWRGALTGGLLGGAAGAGGGYMYRNMNDAQQLAAGAALQNAKLKGQAAVAGLKDKYKNWKLDNAKKKAQGLQKQLDAANKGNADLKTQLAQQQAAAAQAADASQQQTEALTSGLNTAQEQLAQQKDRAGNLAFARKLDSMAGALKDKVTGVYNKGQRMLAQQAVQNANSQLAQQQAANADLQALNERLMGTPQKDFERGQDLARLESEARVGNTGALAQLKRIVAAADEAGAPGRQQKATTAAANVAGAQARSDTLTSLRKQQQALQNDPELQRALKLIEQRNQQQASLQAQIQALNGGVK